MSGSSIVQLRTLRRLGQQLRALGAALESVRGRAGGCGLSAATALGGSPAPAASAARSWSSLAAALAAGGAAGALALQSPASCEAPPLEGLRAVQAAAHELWVRLDEQLHRLDASRPQGQPLPRIPEPSVDLSSGQVSITFHVPQALDVAAGAAEAARRLRSPRFSSIEAGVSGSAVFESRSAGPEATARRLRRSSKALGDLTVDVVVPTDRSQPAEFTFSSPAATAAAGDGLEVMAAALAAAARPRMPSLGGVLDEVAGLFGGGEAGDGVRSLGGLDPFLGPLRDLLEELEAGHREPAWSGGGEHGGRHVPIEPAPRRPKHFDEMDAAAGGSAAPAKPWGSPAAQAAVQKLRSMGAQVFLPAAPPAGDTDAPAASKPPTAVDWGTLAGYEEQKRSIEDCLLLPLLRPDVYDAVARRTRARFAPNRPRAILFVGPPGTGKTTSARVIASQAAVPLVYLPLEALVSKWYGESERQLAEALAACDALGAAGGGGIVFLDELDALATSRGDEGMHEATRRLLGVLLRHIDGFDASARSVVVGATNRPQDLDPALRSRFSATVEFGLPNQATRAAILGQYAHQLGEGAVGALADATPGMAGRDLRDVCEQAERRWAAKIIRGQAQEGESPPLQEYLAAAAERAAGVTMAM